MTSLIVPVVFFSELSESKAALAWSPWVSFLGTGQGGEAVSGSGGAEGIARAASGRGHEVHGSRDLVCLAHGYTSAQNSARWLKE